MKGLGVSYLLQETYILENSVFLPDSVLHNYSTQEPELTYV